MNPGSRNVFAVNHRILPHDAIRKTRQVAACRRSHRRRLPRAAGTILRRAHAAFGVHPGGRTRVPRGTPRRGAARTRRTPLPVDLVFSDRSRRPRSAPPPRGETDAARGALERAERSVGSPDGTLDTVDHCEATSGPAAGPRESGVDRGRFGSRRARPRGRSGRLCSALRALPRSNPELPASHGRRPRDGGRPDPGHLHQGLQRPPLDAS